ncbi:hypothetical protein F4810DRAFT_653253 [Camillea tinctor]|nr:hypothetical protein F4810DRAFT_653253 [Camillea tinctor]
MLCHAATRSPTTLVIALLAIFTRATATCYRPDGSAVDGAYQSLDESAEFSACCRPGTTHNADHGDDNNNLENNDDDTPTGLCAGPGTQLWRGSCTDPTWTSLACLNICVNGDYAAADEVEITTCSDGSFCCGANNTDCCARGDGVFVTGNGEIIPAPPAPASASAPRQPKRAAESPSPSPPPPPHFLSARRIARRALSSEAITGLAVAGAFGAVALITVAVYVPSKWKTVRKPSDPMAALPSGALPSHHAVSLPSSVALVPSRSSEPLYYHSTPLWGATYGRTELDSAARPQELPGCPAGAELAGVKYERW